jgi:methionine-rich copper-binding protein CopC
MDIKRFSSIIILVIFNALLAAGPALAHGDEPRLEISAESLNPGDLLEIRGVDFEFEEAITLSFVGAQVEIPLGVVIADTEGVFQIGVTLPADLPPGTYTVHVRTDDHVVKSPVINVWGSADLGGGEEGPWEEGDGLLAPMPTSVPAVSTPVGQAESSESTPDQNSIPPIGWIVLVLGGILIVAIIRVVKT